MSNQLTERKIEAMFEAWQEKQTVQSVAIKCKVSPTTVRRYRRLFSWDERLDKIRRKAQRIVDEDAARRKARHIKLLQLGQKRCMEGINVDEKGEPVKLSPSDSVRTLASLIEAERKICGDVDAQDQGEVTNNFEIKVVLVGNP